VEELVRDEPERLLVLVRREEALARHLERRARRVLEPAAPLVREVDDEEVALVGEASHHAREVLHDAFRVVREPLQV
jgi:hypothetical protein